MNNNRPKKQPLKKRKPAIQSAPRRKSAEKQLRESEEKYRAVVENIGIGIAVISPEMEIVSLNKQMREWFPGLDGLDNRYKCYRAFNDPPRESICAYCPVVLTFQDGKTHEAITETPSAASTVNYRVLSSPILDETGAVISVIEMVENITGRLTAERAVQESEDRQRVILESTADGILAVNAEGKTLLTNRRFAELWKIPQPLLDAGDDNAMLRYVLDQLIDPDGFLRKVKALYGTDEISSDVLRFKDGRVFERFSTPLLRDREVIGRMWSFRDITERKKSEAVTLETLTRLRTLVDNLQLGLLFEDRSRRILFVNTTFCRLFGIPAPEAIAGADCAAAARQVMTQFADPGGFVRDIEQRIAERKVVLSEKLHLADGRIFERDYMPVLIDREQAGSYWIYHDVTERKQAEEALLHSEEFIRSILDNVDEGFLVVDRDYRIVSANKAYCLQSGASPENAIGRHCFELSHKTPAPCHERGENCAVKQVFESGEPAVAVHKHRDAKGDILYVETKAFPLKNAAGAVTSAIETIHNITERHLLEAEQLKTQKLEAIGTLAGGIAHDFNNLLQGVFGYISMAKLTMDQPAKALAMLNQAEKALSLSVNLTTQLLTFAKGGKPVKKRTDLHRVIENAAKFALSGSRSDYRLTRSEEPTYAEADEGQLGQVIQNIVLNASEAMPDGGLVELSAENVDIPEGHGAVLPAGGKFVKIVIKDSGVGIPEQYLTRIFDPYFTTKQKGSGLGLATSYSIVKNHGGTIEVISEPNRGTKFIIYLPASEPREADDARIVSKAGGRRGRVLVMDDEQTVRAVTREMISALGHEAESAEDGEDAIAKFGTALKSGKPFDVVILDLTVKGGMGGEQTVRILREMDANVKAVVSSGYADDPIVSDHQSYGFAAFLNKPYTISALRDCLQTLLEQRSHEN